MDTNTEYTLASNSPRRKELMTLAGWSFTVSPADVNEDPLPGETPADYVCRLAESKARAAGEKVSGSVIVIAADTTVVHNGSILGKPANSLEAEKMLRDLRGKTHQVMTALAVFDETQGDMFRDLASTDVPMRDYSDAEMYKYIATGDPLDKAGTYAIQHGGFNPVQGITGCYANVVGLPLCHLACILEKNGIQPVEDIPAVCRRRFDYDCQVHQEIREGR